MSIFDALLLGILQGFTEFLPISSSGHLLLLETWLPLSIDPRSLLTFDILLHAATALALLICYAKTWWRIALSPFSGSKKHQRMLLLLILSTIPGALAGVLLEDIITNYFRSIPAVATAFLVTSALLIAAHRARGTGSLYKTKWTQSLSMGLVQACALIPGISRSGSTISIGQLVGLKRKEALDFSFLMALPIIVGASTSAMLDMINGAVVPLPFTVILVGFLSSFGASLIAVLSLRKFVARHSLAWFTLYLIPIAILLLVFAS